MRFNKSGEIGFGMEESIGTRRVRFIGYNQIKKHAIEDAVLRAVHYIEEEDMYRVLAVKAVGAVRRSRNSWFVNIEVTAEALSYKTT